MNALKAFAGALALTAGVHLPAQGAIGVTANPLTPSDIGARIRWGGSGFEAALFDNDPQDFSTTLNPVGTPAWVLGTPYAFQVTFDGSTGVLGLSVDFNNDSTFGAGEYISRSAFSSPGLASYQGYSFRYLQISGNESGSSARSNLSALSINGFSQADVVPNGSLLDVYYGDSGNLLTPITIGGTLTFTSPGTSFERPSWNVRFISPDQIPVTPVPEPGSLPLVALGLLGLAVAYRRKRA